MSEWRSASGGYVPQEAVEGGTDVNGEPIYVGRAYQSGDLTPGKIVPSHGVCYVCHGGKEFSHNNYEYLIGPSYGQVIWVRAYDGAVPSGAVNGGSTTSGEPLYIGRAYYEGSWVIGKVIQSHNVLYIPFGGDEVAISDYEVLCERY